MSEISDLMIASVVLPRLAAGTRKQAIQALSETLARAAGLEPRAVFDPVLMRERLSGTGVGDGVAIPHAQIDGLSRPICGFARLDQPADFNAIDGRSADLVFMLLAPANRGADHLKALARISRFLRRVGICEKLRAARGLDELLALFELTPAAA